MGNHLSGIAPSQILPAENYLADLNSRSTKELEFQRSLGSTRFLKVVLCLSDRGPVVGKIFVIPGPNLKLSEQKKKIKDISTKLLSAVNCLPFNRVEVTERASFIFRPYINSSLYDRISTRPFLSSIEKKWLAFQILCALNQCHQEKICHGDIKLENIMVTSWSWLILTDFASFKPVYLPENNPTDYTFFFDTSRRRVCNIAPERFVQIIPEDEGVVSELVPSMDMFSAGCVLIELFTEGLYPFNLMQLLQYKLDAYYPSQAIDKITDLRARNMVKKMISKNPETRRSAAEFLKEERGKLFPQSFYTFLAPFMKQFAVNPALTADERMHKINDSLTDIAKTLHVGDLSKIERTSETVFQESCNEPLIVIISLIASSVRSLQFPSSKLIALDTFITLSSFVSREIVLDRILPYICNLFKDPNARVRAEAIYTLSQCLTSLQSVPRSEANIFLEYIFPHLEEVSLDEEVIVRQTEAANFALISSIALRCMAFYFRNDKDSDPSDAAKFGIIYNLTRQKLAKTFSDSSNFVKRAMDEESMNLLSSFYGPKRGTEILLQHLVTFLNEKQDFNLRLSFYVNVTTTAMYSNIYCHKVLFPLFLQGLSDTEESVIVCAINNLIDLTEMNGFIEGEFHDFIKDIAPLLIHPNHWIRLAVVGFLSTVSEILPKEDTESVISMAIGPFTKTPLLRQNNIKYRILTSLKEPLQRGVYDALVKSSDVGEVISVLKAVSEKHPSQVHLIPNSLGEEKLKLKQDFKLLLAAGLTDTMVGSILSMEEYLLKIHRQKKGLESLQASTDNQQLGSIGFEEAQSHLLHSYKLNNNDNSIDLSSNLTSSSQSLQKSSSMTMNEEWQTMFGNGTSDDEQRSGSNTIGSSRQSSSLGASLSSQCFMLDQSSKDSPRYIASCQRELELLLNTKREEYRVLSQSRNAAANSAEGASSSYKWRPKGHLVAHLHEHRDAINKLVSLGGTSLFASSSKDGVIKIWDCNKTERTFPVNRSKFTYNKQKGDLKGLDYCSIQDSIASSSTNGSIHVIKVDKQILLTSRNLNTKCDGYASDVNYMNAGSHSLLTYSTTLGKIIGWDLRSPDNAFVIDNGPKQGSIISHAIDKSNNWLACGTVLGFVVCWDLRFMLPVSRVQHEKKISMQKIKLHPTIPSCVIASTRSNNEVVFWDMETQSRCKTLWACLNPPFSDKPTRLPGNRGKTPIDNRIHGLHVGKTESGSTYLFTAGTDSRIRYWDLDSPELSYVVSQSAIYSTKHNYIYASRVIDGSEVILEKTKNSENSEETSDRTPDQPPTGHIETITDVIMVTHPQRMIISSGYDGTIKMWK